MSDLQHPTAAAEGCSATPHTPKGVVVQQLARITCRTHATPKVLQVRHVRTNLMETFQAGIV
jgi:hypothetical protein